MEYAFWQTERHYCFHTMHEYNVKIHVTIETFGRTLTCQKFTMSYTRSLKNSTSQNNILKHCHFVFDTLISISEIIRNPCMCDRYQKITKTSSVIHYLEQMHFHIASATDAECPLPGTETRNRQYHALLENKGQLWNSIASLVLYRNSLRLLPVRDQGLFFHSLYSKSVQS